MECLKPHNAVLLLEDGVEFLGHSFASQRTGFGEVVFNTSMAGYQEVLTDSSYWQQLVVMTYPHQGNYGINDSDSESLDGPKVSGFLVHELVENPSNYTSKQSLACYLKKHDIPGLYGIDTRTLTLHIRSKGAMRGLILSLEERAKLGSNIGKVFSKYPPFLGRDLILEVTTKKPYWFNDSGRKIVVALDFGIKQNLLREIAMRGVKVVVLPATASPKEIFSYKPGGIFLSNGPGDPSGAKYAVQTVRELLGKKPIFGVCMGHQILGLALGGQTFKMKFGHRGVNQPVLNILKKTVEISSHNHGYAIDANSFTPEVRVTHRNLNDGTCEGLECEKFRVFSVQYHPESAPGPHDSGYLFDQFVENISS